MTQQDFLKKLFIWWKRPSNKSCQPTHLCRKYKAMFSEYIFQSLYEISLLSDEAIESIDRHLEDCPWCQRDIIERENQNTGRLVMAIARGGESAGQDCPNNDDLWGFVTKIAAPDLERRIEEHILQCSQCAQAIIWFQTIQADRPS